MLFTLIHLLWRRSGVGKTHSSVHHRMNVSSLFFAVRGIFWLLNSIVTMSHCNVEHCGDWCVTDCKRIGQEAVVAELEVLSGQYR